MKLQKELKEKLNKLGKILASDELGDDLPIGFFTDLSLSMTDVHSELKEWWRFTNRNS